MIGETPAAGFDADSYLVERQEKIAQYLADQMRRQAIGEAIGSKLSEGEVVVAQIRRRATPLPRPGVKIIRTISGDTLN